MYHILKNVEYRYTIKERYLSFLIFLLPFFFFSVYLFLSEGVNDYEAYGHYFSARYLFGNPVMFVHWYSKPLFTGLTALFLEVAPFGIKSLQFFDCLVSSITCLITYKISLMVLKDQKYSILVVILLLTNQLFFTYAYSGLLEPFFALLLVLAMYSYYRREYKKTIFLISLSTLVRLEGFVLIPLWIFFIFKNWKSYGERIKNVSLLFSGPAFWSIMSFLLTNDAFWPLSMYLQENTFGSLLSFDLGLLLHYPSLFVTYVNMVFLVFFFIGLVFSIKTTDNLAILFHIGVISVFAPVWFLLMFSYHPNIPALSMRLFVDILPLSAIVASYGTKEVFSCLLQRNFGFDKRMEGFFLSMVIVLSIITPFAISKEVVRMVPRSFNVRENVERQVGEWLSKNLIFRPGKFYCSNPAIIYYWGVDYFDVLPISNLAIAEPKNESIIIWDYFFGMLEGMPYFLFRQKYRLVATFRSPEYLEKRFEPINPRKMTFVINVFRYDERLLDDLGISESDIWFNRTLPKFSENVLIYTIVHNIERTSKGEFYIVFWVDKIRDENLIKFERISLNGNATFSVEAIWEANLIGTHKIYIVLDVTNEILEYNEYNNLVIVEITVLRDMDTRTGVIYLKDLPS